VQAESKESATSSELMQMICWYWSTRQCLKFSSS
jgi:hypothetical protein